MTDWNFKFVEKFAKEVGTKFNDGLQDAKKSVGDLATQSKPKLEQALSAVKESAHNVKEKASTSVENIHKLSLNAIDLDKLQQPSSHNPKERPKSGERYSDTISKLLQAYEVTGATLSSKSKQSSSFITVTPRVLATCLPKNVAQFATSLNERFGEKYLVYNLSEKKYDSQPFQGNVVEYSFPGHSSPPLGLLFELCLSLESWLNADPQNVAVIHCLTGKGRTAVLISCLLAWLEDHHVQEQEKRPELEPMPTPNTALGFVCKKLGSSVTRCTLPSQRLYVSYFARILEGVRPRLEPIKLERIVVNAGKGKVNMPGMDPAGSRPYIQLFKNGKLLFSSIWEDSKREGGTRSFTEEEVIEFPVDCKLDGDILLRFRHVDTSEEGKPKSMSMFRCAFHTGFIPIGSWKLAQKDLDGVNCCKEGDLSVELVFAEAGPQSPEQDEGAENFDKLIHAKSSFWEEISKRKARKREYRMKAEATGEVSPSQHSPPPSFSILGDEEDAFKDAGQQQAAVDFGLEGNDGWREELEALSFSETKSKAKSASVDAKAEEGAEDDLALLEEELGLNAETSENSLGSPNTELMNDAKGEEVTNQQSRGEEGGSSEKEAEPKPPRKAAAEDDLAELEDYLNSVNET